MLTTATQTQTANRWCKTSMKNNHKQFGLLAGYICFLLKCLSIEQLNRSRREKKKRERLPVLSAHPHGLLSYQNKGSSYSPVRRSNVGNDCFLFLVLIFS